MKMTSLRTTSRRGSHRAFTLIELVAAISIIVVMMGVALVAFFKTREGLTLRTALGQVDSLIRSARNSAMSVGAPSRVVVTNVSSGQRGGAGPAVWEGTITAELPELISEWDFQNPLPYAYHVAPDPWPTPSPTPPDVLPGVAGHLAVVYKSLPSTNLVDGKRGKALHFDGTNVSYLRLYAYDESRFAEDTATRTPSPTPTIHILSPPEYALRPYDLRWARLEQPAPAPTTKPFWWNTTYPYDETDPLDNSYRYLGRPGLRFEAWVYHDPTPSPMPVPPPDPLPGAVARVLFAKPPGKREGPDRRVDYLIEIWPDITPNPDPITDAPGTRTGVTDALNAQLYACFISYVETDSGLTAATDAAYSGRFGIPPRRWTHVTVNWNPAAADRADRLSLYIDGIKRTKLCKPIHYASDEDEIDPPPFVSTPLGRDYGPNDRGLVQPFLGMLDELRISRIVNRSRTLPDNLRFALLGGPRDDLQEIAFGWDAQGRLADSAGQILEKQLIIVTVNNRNTRLVGDVAPNAMQIPVDNVGPFAPEGLLAIGKLVDPSDSRSALKIKELVRYSAAQKGRGAATDSFLVSEDGRGYTRGIGTSLSKGYGVYQAVLVRVGLRGDVRVDDGT